MSKLNTCVQYKIYFYKERVCVFLDLYTAVETLGLSMELNDDILVQTTSLQTIARIKRVKSRLPQK